MIIVLVAEKKATACVQKAFRRDELKLNPSLKSKDIKFRVKDHEDKIRQKQLTYKFQENYFPEGWLAWCLGGHRFLNDGKMLACLLEPKGFKASPGLADIEQMGIDARNSLPSKTVRGAIQNNLQKTPQSSITNSNESSNQKTTSTLVIHRIEETPKDDSEQLSHWTLQLLDLMDKAESETNPVRLDLWNTLILNAQSKVKSLKQKLNLV